jgi:AmmeMemoRadiSam system protein A
MAMSLLPPKPPAKSSSHELASQSQLSSPQFTGEFTGSQLNDVERELLLRVAHQSILSSFDKKEIQPEPPAPQLSAPHLAEPRGAFTSLYLRGELRGCVGYVLPTCSVYQAVAETARAAAFDDSRFPPVSREEAPHLAIELSILSRPQPIRAEDVEVGRHGLLISLHGRRGLLLPQVPAEHAWDRTTFLEQTCRKAGLSLDAWQKGATIEAFTAEVFGDKNASVAADPAG